MMITLNDTPIYVATGGQPFNAKQPTIVFLHGSGLDHRFWALQTRWFAFHGYSVIAPDFPGHSLSHGEALASIEAMSYWLWQLLDRMKVKQCSLVGHSQGGLVALEAASLQPERVKSVSLIASSAAIPVNDQLLGLAQQDQAAAAAAMVNWGFGEAAHFGLSHIPGQAPMAAGYRIMCQNPLYTDLLACQQYHHGIEAAETIHMPAQLLFSKADRMTPIKAGRELKEHLSNVTAYTELEKVGHMIPMEAPELCLKHLQNFISSTV